MSSILRIARKGIALTELGLPPDTPGVALSASKRAAELNAVGTLASGKEAGVPVPDEVKPNQRITWDFGTLRPREYQVAVTVNPLLLELGTVSCPSMLEPREEVNLKVTLHSAVGGSVAQLDWIVRLYLIN